jgi:hypothetical protein
MSDTEVTKDTKKQDPVEGVTTEQPASKKEHELKKGHKKANVQKKKKQVEEGHVSEPEEAEKEQQDQGQNQEDESEVSDQETASEEETESEDEEDELVQKLTGLKVNKSYKVLDQDGNVVGKVVAGNRKKAVGRRVKENGSIIDSKGNFIASVAPVKPEEISGEADQAKNKKEEEGEQQEEAQDGQAEKQGDEQPAKEEEKATEEEPPKEEEKATEEEPPKEDEKATEEEPPKEDEKATEEEPPKEDEKATEEEPPKEDEKATEEEPPKGDEKAPEPELEKSTAPVSDDAPTVDETGKIIDQSGNVVGKLKKGKAHELAGMSIDEEGNVVDEDGNILGKAELTPPEKTEEEKKAEAEEQETRKIADQMSTFIEQALHRIKPILKMITEHIETEERKPEKERDEEKLVNSVRPLIEEGSNILGETNGAIRGLDPTGKIAKTAQAKSAERKASPEEYRLAELLSTLTGEVTKTIENAKKKIAGMPHAEEELSPLWYLLQNPLLQILAAVGLLLSGVLGLLGNILNGLGLGGLVNNLLGGLGLDKILQGLGVGKLLGGLGGKKKK